MRTCKRCGFKLGNNSVSMVFDKKLLYSDYGCLNCGQNIVDKKRLALIIGISMASNAIIYPFISIAFGGFFAIPFCSFIVLPFIFLMLMSREMNKNTDKRID